MRIILISGRGDSRAVEFGTGRLLAALVAGAGACALLVALNVPSLIRDAVAFVSPAVDDAIVRQWQMGLQTEQQALAALRDRARADSEATGRLLAQMEARLFRMEALGQRLVSAAAFDPEEFDFSTSPAVGGPAPEPVAAGFAGAGIQGAAPESGEIVLFDLRRDIEMLASRLRARESELGILESLLFDKDRIAALEIGGSPVRKGWISSPFGWRVDPITGNKALHAGVDFAGPMRSDVLSVASGVVTFAGVKAGYGQLVEISHGDGFLTRYGHHDELLVKVGDVVRKGEVIGLMGRTGRTTGSHLHFEVSKGGLAVDPARFLSQGG